MPQKSFNGEKKKEQWEPANIMHNYFHKKFYAACVDVTRAKNPTKSSAFLPCNPLKEEISLSLPCDPLYHPLCSHKRPLVGL